MKAIVLFLVTFNFIWFSQLYAATDGQIGISATVSAIAAVIASDTDANPIDQLGIQAYNNAKIGTVILHSNDIDGFTLTLDSATHGVLGKDGTSTDSGETLAYKVSIRNAAGTLGKNIIESGLTDVDPNGGVISFLGSHVSPTYGRQYDVGITTPIKGLVQGNYSDTLTITITNQ
ncbi:MAG: hypothetical protein ACI9BD_000027 [Candidatus Marinamargulisbacteria bacterium]|jgi:hypothetical protein